MKTNKRRLGDIGEFLASKFLIKNGFNILEKNFLRYCGEIDIIASLKDIVYFVEVKTVTRKTNYLYNSEWGKHTAEENIGRLKIKRLRKVVASYLRENNVLNEWKFMVISIELEKKSNKILARYNVLYDVL